MISKRFVRFCQDFAFNLAKIVSEKMNNSGKSRSDRVSIKLQNLQEVHAIVNR